MKNVSDSPYISHPSAFFKTTTMIWNATEALYMYIPLHHLEYETCTFKVLLFYLFFAKLMAHTLSLSWLAKVLGVLSTITFATSLQMLT